MLSKNFVYKTRQKQDQSGSLTCSLFGNVTRDDQIISEKAELLQWSKNHFKNIIMGVIYKKV